jgi:aldehyde:ferredoxin oxidoreductase
MKKIMRVNLSELQVKVEDMPKEYQGLGGRGLSSHIVGREVPPKTNPLDSENKLIFSASINEERRELL